MDNSSNYEGSESRSYVERDRSGSAQMREICADLDEVRQVFATNKQQLERGANQFLPELPADFLNTLRTANDNNTRVCNFTGQDGGVSPQQNQNGGGLDGGVTQQDQAGDFDGGVAQQNDSEGQSDAGVDHRDVPPPVLRQTPSIDTSRYPDLGVPSPANPQLQSEDLTRLYLRNRERIDTNHDGELSRGELDSAMINPNFRGEDAQAVAFLRSQHNALTGQYDDPRAGITEADMAVYDDRQRQGRENLTRANQIHYGTENFDSLDSNHDGRLTNNELDSALQNQQLTAEQRGSLQEIRNHSGEIANARNDGQGNGISRDDLQSYENDLRQRRNSRIASSVDGALHQSGERIAGTNHDAFGGRPPLESIRPEAVRQGTEGDCALQATLASMARTNPGAIRDMIHDNQDGTYTVTFPGDRRHPVRVAAPTDSELAAYGGGSEYGTWPAIIERAYGVHENPNVTVPGDVAAHSGDTEEHTRRTMELLTGHQAHDSEVAEMSDPELQRVLARSNRHPVTALVNGDTRWSDNVQPGSGLQGTHAYSVVGYDPHTHQVTLRNPWGQGEIGGRGHARDGHDDGTFTMSYEEFRRYISRVNY